MRKNDAMFMQLALVEFWGATTLGDIVSRCKAMGLPYEDGRFRILVKKSPWFMPTSAWIAQY